MKLLTVIILSFISLISSAQEPTTIILLRHAEKADDGTSDPNLTPEGVLRAQELVRLMADVHIDDIYSTPFNRTRSTVAPLAKSKGLEIKEYNPFKLEEVADLINTSKGKTLVFSGHSNTTPILINLMIGEDKFKQLNEGDYDNLYIVTISDLNDPKVIQLAYGQKSIF